MHVEEMIHNDFSYYHSFFENLRGDKSYRRLGKVFETKKKYYYDVGTGKILECEEDVFAILKALEESNSFDSILNLGIQEDALLNALGILKCTVDKENIMKAPPFIQMIGPQTIQLEDHVNENLSQLTLEITQRCNLRCKYCIYQDKNGKFRNFNKEHDMDFNTAKKAIDYAIQHSAGKDFHLTFYGGEPLLNFDLIRQCVEYLQSKKMNDNIFYSLTTNLTLLTEDKAKYFASIPNFSIVCSLDGDRQTHDENRVTIDNKGSFDLAIKGLKNLVQAYEREKVGQILINMVICEPYTTEKFDRIQNFIENCPYIFQEMTIMYSYVDYGDSSATDANLSLSKNEALEYWNPLEKWEKEKSVNSNRRNLFSSYNTARGFIKLHNRELSNMPIQDYLFNGCCIPGSRKLYVTTRGNFQVCERIGEGPIIGNVDIGMDFKVLHEKFVDEYNRESSTDCSDCWAVRLCNLCYARCYNKNGIDINVKRNKCFHDRRMAEYCLSEYHRILEEDPKSLEYLNDMI